MSNETKHTAELLARLTALPEDVQTYMAERFAMQSTLAAENAELRQLVSELRDAWLQDAMEGDGIREELQPLLNAANAVVARKLGGAK